MESNEGNSYCCGDIEPKVVGESVKGELFNVDPVDEGGKNGPPVNVKCDENGAPPIRFLI